MSYFELAASVYYRVLESILPSMNYEIHEKLKISSKRVRESASLKENFVQEHFAGSSCSEFYDIHGRNKLGKGSYGSVYLATHRITRDERAVKVMNVDRVTSYYLRKLHTEICILKEVDHPNIIKLQDVFFGRRSVYLVTDLCRGGELYELLTSGKNQGFVFREDRAGKLMNDMMSSVKYLHSLGIVHRDLKLENFLFEGSSSNSSLILIDFGLSKHYDSIERMRQRVGSCYYTAPEVLSGDYDERCDIWSLGVICYMLLSGTPPFFGKTPEEIHNSTLTKEAEFPAKRFRHVSHIALDFMRRLLVKDPNRRITLADALMHPFITGATHTPAPSPSMSAAPLPPPSKLQIVNSVRGLHILMPECLKINAVGILNSLRLFASFPMLTKIVLEVIAYTITADQVCDFRAEFLALDSDSSGTINMQELKALAVVGNSLLQASSSGPAMAMELFDNLEQMMGGIIHPRRLRHVASSSTMQSPSVSECTTMDEGYGGTSLSGGVAKADNSSSRSRSSLGSLSSSPGLQDPFGTSESCSSLYTNPSSRSHMPSQRFHDVPNTKSDTVQSSTTTAVSHSSDAITYSEYIAAAMCGRLEIEEERVAVAFDLLDAGRQGALTAEAITTFLGKDIDTSILHHDILLTKSQVSRDDNDSDYNAAGIDQETFFKAWRGAGFSQLEEGEGEGDLQVSSMMSTDSTANDQGL
jgi:serine/threonine protein kinase